MLFCNVLNHVYKWTVKTIQIFVNMLKLFVVNVEIHSVKEVGQLWYVPYSVERNVKSTNISECYSIKFGLYINDANIHNICTFIHIRKVSH